MIYKKLVKECSDDQEDERLTNLSAVNGALSMFEGVEVRFKMKTSKSDLLIV